MTDPVDECQGGAGAECPWNDRRSERWIAAVEAAAWLDRGGGEWVKELDCPRCGHRMTVRYEGWWIPDAVAEIERLHRDSKDFAERASELLGRGGEGFAESAADNVPARCNCSHEHDGQPDNGDAGCGQWGVFSAPEET